MLDSLVGREGELEVLADDVDELESLMPRRWMRLASFSHPTSGR